MHHERTVDSNWKTISCHSIGLCSQYHRNLVWWDQSETGSQHDFQAEQNRFHYCTGCRTWRIFLNMVLKKKK